MLPSCTPFFFFTHTATTEIYTLSLHDALPISHEPGRDLAPAGNRDVPSRGDQQPPRHLHVRDRSEEHTSELQSHHDLVCRLLLEKKKNKVKRSNKSKHKTK